MNESAIKTTKMPIIEFENPRKHAAIFQKMPFLEWTHEWLVVLKIYLDHLDKIDYQ